MHGASYPATIEAYMDLAYGQHQKEYQVYKVSYQDRVIATNNKDFWLFSVIDRFDSNLKRKIHYSHTRDKSTSLKHALKLAISWRLMLESCSGGRCHNAIQC
jgi:hypothetical protein